ncbi:choline/glycine/proline betaine transport protein [Tamilnaduibacter salinus]|uniref:Choline/glycine/proline betaine transport protein n=1 Tax=Tamilnaduibacter salinus TaxID=1484056 RepID=A0A2U1CWR9_9GAMM|nr:choline BCCT transporter BetT [Tamilnaduibacter salinus]PVY76374.1 choline/glycine/proline betaine transport protein [Tamilnaduibacter salinus]
MSQHPLHGSDPDDRLNPLVFYGSTIGIIVFALWAMVFTDQANATIGQALSWISNSFGWFYFLSVVAYLVFVIVIAFSRFGSIKLGPDHSEPEFNLITWAAMLFSAGIGIDLIFYCIVEPLSQFMAPPLGEGGTAEAARHAMELTFLHWGLSGWGVYTLVGMSLAFFSYRHGMPLTIRSALYPIFGKRIHGTIGNTVDIAAVLGTVFGVATSLGIGIIQLNFGLSYMFGIPENTATQSVLAVLIVCFSAISAVTGVDKGIRRLSEFNILLAIVLMAFVLFAGDTTFLLNAFVMNVGDYLSGFVAMSFNTYAFDQPTGWLNAWTVFFWAWWIAWGPFVGLFLARISRGRTVRTFVAGTLILPLTFMMAWMSIMGNSAIDLVLNGGAQAFAESATSNPGSAIYLFLEQLPWVTLTTIVVTILAIVFFITSGDSGSLVLSNLTSIIRNPNNDAPAWMRITWAAIIGVVTVALLATDGLTALQSIVVVMGLPFAFVLFLMMAGLYKAFKIESMKTASMQDVLAGQISARTGSESSGQANWAKRLSRTLSFPNDKQMAQFLDSVVEPAFEAVRNELSEQGYPVTVHNDRGERRNLSIDVDLGGEQDFTYQVWPRRCAMPSFTVQASHSRSSYYRVEVHLREGGLNYDLMGYNQEQVIEDVVDHFEAHLHFLYKKREAAGLNDSGEE